MVALQYYQPGSGEVLKRPVRTHSFFLQRPVVMTLARCMDSVAVLMRSAMESKEELLTDFILLFRHDSGSGARAWVAGAGRREGRGRARRLARQGSA